MDWVFVVDIEQKVVPIPSKVQLYQNYPNPFNPNTIIEYYINENGMVNLTIYDSIGRVVRVLVDKTQSKGFHIAQFNGQNLASGIYFYRLNTEDKSKLMKMTLIK